MSPALVYAFGLMRALAVTLRNNPSDISVRFRYRGDYAMALKADGARWP